MTLTSLNISAVISVLGLCTINPAFKETLIRIISEKVQRCKDAWPPIALGSGNLCQHKEDELPKLILTHI